MDIFFGFMLGISVSNLYWMHRSAREHKKEMEFIREQEIEIQRLQAEWLEVGDLMAENKRLKKRLTGAV